MSDTKKQGYFIKLSTSNNVLKPLKNTCMCTFFLSGLYLQLKDRSLPVKSRLKLLKYAWTSSGVYIPNKHQVLLDLLFGFLINKKK